MSSSDEARTPEAMAGYELVTAFQAMFDTEEIGPVRGSDRHRARGRLSA